MKKNKQLKKMAKQPVKNEKILTDNKTNNREIESSSKKEKTIKELKMTPAFKKKRREAKEERQAKLNAERELAKRKAHGDRIDPDRKKRKEIERAQRKNFLKYKREMIALKKRSIGMPQTTLEAEVGKVMDKLGLKA